MKNLDIFVKNKPDKDGKYLFVVKHILSYRQFETDHFEMTLSDLMQFKPRLVFHRETNSYSWRSDDFGHTVFNSFQFNSGDKNYVSKYMNAMQAEVKKTIKRKDK